MTRVYMVRHGRAAAGWDVDPDPALDELGRTQSLSVASRLSARGPLPIISSPLLRCQQTAFPRDCVETASCHRAPGGGDSIARGICP